MKPWGTIARVQLLLLLLFVDAAAAAPLPRSAPEAQGIASPAILEFIEAADEIDSLHSFMLVRHGQVVAEGWWAPYRAEARHQLYSLSKSFTSTAVGLAVAEGKLSIDDSVLAAFPDDAPAEPSANLKSMRLSDLLRMSTGHQYEPARKPTEPWTQTFLAQPVPFKPGTHFLYNTSATYMQSAMVQKATSQTVLEYLRPRLFEPLGIEDPTWEQSPQGISTGGYGLSIRTEDIAKFGQLYLQRGEWQGRQLVPEAWIAAATDRQTSNGSSPESDWDQGYGYQFWRCRHGAYRGDGAFGQYCIVMPGQDTVVAITSGLKDMQQVLNLVWDKLLPAMQDASLPPDDAAAAKLAAKLKTLALRLPENMSEPVKVAGKRYDFPENNQKIESVWLEQDGASGLETVVVKVDGAERRMVCGHGQWHDGSAAWAAIPNQPAAASGGWSGDTFTAKVCFYETPFVVTLQLHFKGDELTFDAEQNVGFTLTRLPQITGKLQKKE